MGIPGAKFIHFHAVSKKGKSAMGNIESAIALNLLSTGQFVRGKLCSIYY